MAQPQEVIATFAANLWVIKRQLEGLSHDDSLIQPPFQANCLNWVLGHILVGRHSALEYLDQAGVWGPDEKALYATGSDPITSSAQALKLEALVAALDLTQERLAATIEAVDAETWQKSVQLLGRDRTLGEALAGLAWHETYHAGQTELLRQLAGMNDQVI